MTVDRYQNSTAYEHPQESNLLNIHKTLQYNSSGQPVARVHVDGITLEGDVLVDTVSLSSSTLAALESINVQNTVSVVVSNFPTTSTVYQGTDPWRITGTVNISTLPEVEIKNDLNNPIPVSRNTATNSAINPIYVSNEGAVATVTAFEEPLAVGITPVIQAHSVYGLDPAMWAKSQINGGTVTNGESVFAISATTQANSFARLRSTQFLQYRPGQGAMARWTAAFTTSSGTGANSLGVTNAPQLTGLFGRKDGFGVGFSGDPANPKFGVVHLRAGKVEVRTLTLTQHNTGAQTAVITLNGVAYTISLTASTSTLQLAGQIQAKLRAITAADDWWDIDHCGSNVYFVYYTTGSQNGTYSFSSTGTGTLATGTFARTVAGEDPEEYWHYIDTWTNLPGGFEPSKLNVYGLDFRWLGAGRVRFFIEEPLTGKLMLIHEINWTSLYLSPHILLPSLPVTFRAGPTDGTTPAAAVTIRGASAFAAIQGEIVQTNSSQGYSNIDSTNRPKDDVHHLISIQNPFVRGNHINSGQILLQTLTIAAQSTDPSIIYLVRNAVGTSSYLAFNNIPNADVNFNFAQIAVNAATENLSVDQQANVQTLGINASATFDLMNYNFRLVPGEYLSVFISSSNAITRTSVGLTWMIE